jgi:hypothetical protein
MSDIITNWRSPEGRDNALALQATFPAAFEAMAELDALGHRMLARVSGTKITGIDRLVGVAMMRRAVTLFVGVRHLFEASAIEPAKLVLRASFETLLAFRYLVHGGKSTVDLFTPSDQRKREARARYFFVAAERQLVYSRQSLLDGRWGGRKVSGKERKRLKAEVQVEVARLQRQFPAQTNSFGVYRCYLPNKKRRYYDARDWYSFGFKGGKVNNIRALAARFKWLGEYELLYASFSGMMHPRGISHDAKITDQGYEIYHPYFAEAFELLVYWACSWQMLILAAAMQAYSPESLPDEQDVLKKVSPILRALDAAKIPDGLI